MKGRERFLLGAARQNVGGAGQAPCHILGSVMNGEAGLSVSLLYSYASANSVVVMTQHVA